MLKKYRAPSIVVLCLTLVLVVFQNCGGGGGGGGGGSLTSSSSASGQCAPTITVGGNSYDRQLCLLNQQAPGYCMVQGNPCRTACTDEYNRRMANNVSGGALVNFLSSCNASCSQEYAACLYQNSYPQEVCDEPVVIPNPDCVNTSVTTGNGLGEPTTWTNPWNTGTTGSSGGGATTTKLPGFENCDITAKYYAAEINYLGICQSSLDETSVAVNSTVSDSARTCMIPTHKDQSGNSAYLGGPQCFAPQAGVITMGQLSKTRSGFTNSTLNGLMVMKESSLTAYFTCMDAYITFTHPSCPYGANTNSTCAQMANASMATICNNFKAGHSYIDIRLN